MVEANIPSSPHGSPQAELIESIRKAYRSIGAAEVSSAPLYVNDGTVVFASCTISNFRDDLKSQDLDLSVFCIQPCARFQVLRDIAGGQAPDGASIFKMYGGFERCDRGSVDRKFAKHVLLYRTILELLGDNDRKLAFVGSKAIVNMFSDETALKVGPGHLDIDRLLDEVVNPLVMAATDSVILVPSSYSGLRWHYGDGSTGEGIRVLVANQDNDDFINVGNVIIVFDSSGNPVGIDSGGGFEKTLQALYGGRGSFDWSGIFENFNCSDEIRVQSDWVSLLIGLESTIQIYNFPESFDHPLSVVRKDLDLAINVVNTKMKKLGLAYDGVCKLVDAYISNVVGLDDGIGSNVLKGLQGPGLVRRIEK